MSDTWNDIQAIKNRHSNMRAKMMARRKQREGIVAELIELSGSSGTPSIVPANIQAPALEQPAASGISKAQIAATASTAVKVATDPEVEKKLLMVLCDISLDIPSDSKVIMEHTSRLMEREVDLLLVEELLRKFAAQKLISIKFTEGMEDLIVNSLDFTKLSAMTKNQSRKRKYESDDEEEEEVASKQIKTSAGPETGDIESLLSMQTTKEREEKKLNEEIQALLVTQTAKEQLLVEKFKSRGGPQLQEFCQYGTREECLRTGPEGPGCKRLHFKKIIHEHTDESLGDCSFLNTCFHMEVCKDSSNMAANVTPTTHQPISSGSLQQHPVTSWYYDYENNINLSSHYADHRQSQIGRPYVPVTCTNSAMLNPSNVNSVLYPSAPIPDTSHISARSFSTGAGLQRVEQSRQYLISSNTDSIPVNPSRVPNVNISGEMARPFPPSGSLSTPAEAHPSGGMPVSHHSSGSREIRNIPERPYHVLTGAETVVAPPPLISDMPSTSAFQYSSSIPYTLTAPPPAPAASAVTSPPFTQVGDMPSFDLTGQMASYPWSLSGDLFPSNINVSSTETKSLPKVVKLKCVSANGKKRVRHPEMWKKNLTKTKKLKGEEHVSRTGNVIPAKRVEIVDCSSCSFKCQEGFNEDLRQQLFDVFYSLGSNESQKQFVCQNVQESATKVNGSNKKEGATENKRKVCRKYFLPDTDNTRKQVCSKFFCGTLAIGKTFITHALRNKQFGCYIGKEKRGKPHNKIPDMLLEPARQHITAMLAGSSSGSKKNSKKKCLERGLNITKMHEMYKHECLEKGLSPYVHYEIDYPSQKLTSADSLRKEALLGKLPSEIGDDGSVQMYPPQWIQCDLRYFDMSTLGKCAVVMADPPWDIHMELPYGTMGDNEMRGLDIPKLQDEGFIFLWVTGRAMELGRECLELWGYKRVDEIIWVKTNQLQRIIRTGRTGHWINHGKEHCLVGVKGNPKGINKGMDCDVIVAEVRATSHKPDEIYGIIERLSPGTRKVELFGRPHNVQPNWITLGNQLEGVRLKDPDIVKLFREKYPDGNCMGPSKPR